MYATPKWHFIFRITFDVQFLYMWCLILMITSSKETKTSNERRISQVHRTTITNLREGNEQDEHRNANFNTLPNLKNFVFCKSPGKSYAYLSNKDIKEQFVFMWNISPYHWESSIEKSKPHQWNNRNHSKWAEKPESNKESSLIYRRQKIKHFNNTKKTIHY